MKVLHIISSGGMYGAEAVILNLSRTLNEGGHHGILGVFSNSANPNLHLHESAVKAGVESHLIPCQGQIDRTVTRRIRELARQTQADVVHAHGYKADVYVYLALRGSGIPLVSTCHNWLEQNPLVSFYGMVDRFVLRNYTAVVAVSDEVRRRLLNAGVREDQIYKVENGIDLRPFERARRVPREGAGAGHALTVGWVGRLSREKGADILIHAAAKVLIQLRETKFMVVGDGPERNDLESLIDKLNIRSNVSLMGRSDDMPSMFASFDVVVSSSRQEGLPMAILEGMASRLPWVATAVGDVPTVVQDDVTGVLVPPEDAELLAAALVDLLQDADRRERLGGAARKLVENKFSAERMTGDYLRIYTESMRRVKRSIN
jgi:glycosyltransferase involved in cell wall biosynthesis